METILTARQMQAGDRYTIDELLIPSAVLMERASCAIADRAEAALRSGACRNSRVLCVCGTGNNGGDGIACARILAERGITADLLFAGDPEHRSKDNRKQTESALRCGIRILQDADFSAYGLIVDALFGIGLTRQVEGVFAEAIGRINRSGAYVIAADIPSGLDADTGRVLGCAVRADETVTMQFRKPGQLLLKGREYCGTLTAAGIGIRKKPVKEAPELYALTREDLKQFLPPRIPDGNKGTCGKLLVAAGSEEMAGAAYFAAKAALLSGCGMVKILTHERNRGVLLSLLPEAMLRPYSSDQEAAEALREELSWCDAAAAGPGLGTSGRTRALVRILLEGGLPLVLDADAVNVLEGPQELKKQVQGPVFLTPHPGEAARFASCTVPEIREHLTERGLALAEETGAVFVMKDACTCTAFPDGSAFLNTSGNDGMGTAGSGDVLTGILGGLLARFAGGKLPGCRMAGPLAVYLHGLAGDQAARELGRSSVTASAVLAGIPVILKEAEGE